MVFAAASFDLHPEMKAERIDWYDLFLSEAEKILQRESGHPTLESVQSRLIECFYLLSTSRAADAYNKFGAVAQMIMTLGLHRRRRTAYTSKPDPVEEECRKRAFWAAYILDRYISVMGRRPRIFQDPDIDQAFPGRVNDETLISSQAKSRAMTFDCNMDASIMHISLASIIGETSREMYAIGLQSQKLMLANSQRMLDDLADWKSQLPLFLGSIDPSSLHLVLRQQSIILRLAHTHAVIHATRHFLLSNFTRGTDDCGNQSGLAQQRKQCQHQIHRCVSAAKETIDLLDLIEETEEFPEKFYANWFTQYVAFSAVAVLYLHEIQRRQDKILTVAGDGNIADLPLSSESPEEQNYFHRAQRSYKQVATAAIHNAPGEKYMLFLEELKLEISQLDSARGETGCKTSDLTSVQLQTTEPESRASVSQMGENGEMRDDEPCDALMKERDLDFSQIFDNWVFPGWMQSAKQ